MLRMACNAFINLLFVVVALAREEVVPLDMPLPCRLPDDQAASQVTPGKDRCHGRSIGHLTMRSLRSLPVSKHCCWYPQQNVTCG